MEATCFSKYRPTSNRLHADISQNMQTFITNTVCLSVSQPGKLLLVLASTVILGYWSLAAQSFLVTSPMGFTTIVYSLMNLQAV
jgi:hypothetical protein